MLVAKSEGNLSTISFCHTAEFLCFVLSLISKHLDGFQSMISVLTKPPKHEQ